MKRIGRGEEEWRKGGEERRGLGSKSGMADLVGKLQSKILFAQKNIYPTFVLFCCDVFVIWRNVKNSSVSPFLF